MPDDWKRIYVASIFTTIYKSYISGMYFKTDHQSLTLGGQRLTATESKRGTLLCPGAKLCSLDYNVFGVYTKTLLSYTTRRPRCKTEREHL